MTEPSRPASAQRVALPDGRTSWTLLGPTGPVVPVESFLTWMTNIGRSPNTVRAYALDLQTLWAFLGARAYDWESLSLEQLGEFVGWLRRPADNVLLLGEARPQRSPATIKRTLSAVTSFYDYQRLNGASLSDDLIDGTRSGRGAYRPFLAGISEPQPHGRLVHVRVPKKRPKVLTLEQVRAILAAQSSLRNRFLFSLLFQTGMRVGQALGMRHADFVSRDLTIRLVPRDSNANGARGKRGEGEIPISRELAQAYSDYLHEEYGDIGSDYVFVNLGTANPGAAMTYGNVNDIVRRTRLKVGFHFTPHQLRHTFVTRLRQEGVPLDVVSRLVTHRSSATTSDIYTDWTPESLRNAMSAAGVLEAEAS